MPFYLLDLEAQSLAAVVVVVVLGFRLFLAKISRNYPKTDQASAYGNQQGPFP